MKFLKYYLKKNKILHVCVNDKSCSSPEGVQPYQKMTPAWLFSCKYSKSFRDSFFYRTTPAAAFELCFSIRKEFEKKRKIKERLPLI